MKAISARLSLACVSLIIISLIFTGVSHTKIDPKTIAGIWLFDEGNGEVTKDSSGNGNDGKLMKGPKWVGGKFGSALEFDGTDDYVDAGSGASLDITGDITVVAWIKPSRVGPNQNILSKGDYLVGDACTYILEAFSDNKFLWGNIQAAVPGQAIRSKTVPSFEVGKWTHVAATFNPKSHEAAIYVNGKEDNREAIPSTPPSKPKESLYIGKLHYGNQNMNTFGGIIDEVAIFNAILIEDDIKSIMKGLSSVLAVSPSGKLAAIWGRLKQ